MRTGAHQGAARRLLTTSMALGGAAGLTWSSVTWSSRAAADDGIIHACLQKNQGQLRVVGAGAPCRPDEVAIAWNIQGPPGPQGPTGPQGPAGISGLQRVDFSSRSNSLSPKHAFAKCPSGKKVVGCGAQVFMGVPGVETGPVALKKSKPIQDLSGCTAMAEEITPTDLNWFLTSYALCAVVSP